jgi:hypothetical protein
LLICIDPRAKALWPIFVSHDENDPDMEKEMHNLYLSGNYRDINITSKNRGRFSIISHLRGFARR